MIHGVHDPARQPERIDLLRREAALLRQLALEVRAIELLDRAHQRRLGDPIHVHDLVLHAPLDLRRDRVHGLHGIPRIGLAVRRDRHRLAERDQDATPKRFARLEREPDGDDGKPARMRVLVPERDAGRAGLDTLYARFGVRRPFGVDRDELLPIERRGARGEHLGIPVGAPGRLGAGEPIAMIAEPGRFLRHRRMRLSMSAHHRRVRTPHGRIRPPLLRVRGSPRQGRATFGLIRGRPSLRRGGRSFACSGVIRLPVDGNRAARGEESSEQGMAEQRRRREIVHGARQHGADQQRIDQVVRMVDAQQHRATCGHAFGVPHVDPLEEEPEPEAADRANHAVEAIARAVRPGRGHAL